MRCIFSGTPFHTPPLLLRLEDHLSNFLRHFCKTDVSVFMMIDKFHNGDLAFELCKKFWFLESFLLVFIPHLTSHASVSHKDECLGFIYILCMLLCCKERSVVCNKTKQKQETPDKTQGSRGPQRKAVQSNASHCTWPWWSQATSTPTPVTGSAPRSPSCGNLRVMAPHFLKVITFLRVCHMASSLGL